MNHMMKNIFVCCLSLTPLCWFLDTDPSCEEVSGLRSPNREQREQSADAIRKDREKLIKDLIELARKKVEPVPLNGTIATPISWHDTKHLSIILLGDLRAIEAIPVLLDNVAYLNVKSDVVYGAPLDVGEAYPAVGALVKIGAPAIQPVLERLGDGVNDGRGGGNYCYVLEKILGEKLAKIRLQLAIDEARNERVKSNLEKAAQSYFKMRI
jgi:hypothetical protein